MSSFDINIEITVPFPIGTVVVSDGVRATVDGYRFDRFGDSIVADLVPTAPIYPNEVLSRPLAVLRECWDEVPPPFEVGDLLVARSARSYRPHSIMYAVTDTSRSADRIEVRPFQTTEAGRVVDVPPRWRDASDFLKVTGFYTEDPFDLAVQDD